MKAGSAPEIIRLLSRGNPSNSFLILSERPHLIDTGMGDNRDLLLSSVEKHLAGQTLSAIVLTHIHHDHSGNAAFLSRRLGCPVLAHQNAVDMLHDGDDGSCLAWAYGVEPEPVDATGIVEGQDLDLGGGLLARVLHTPGHTSDSICIHLEESGILISGDTVFADGGTGRTDLPTGNGRTLMKSIARLTSLRPVTLLPGHGRCVDEGTADYLDRLADALGLSSLTS